jgi:NTE family protein
VRLPEDRPRPSRPRVAIACQGGGSHTAFTAGVLKRLLEPQRLEEYEVVGLSGTSGGAVCATLAWAALVDGDPARAGRLLDGFWTDNSASAPAERLLNAWGLWASTLGQFVVTPAISPYDSPFSEIGMEDFRAMLLRQVDPAALGVRPDDAMLLIGAVDVLSGEFRTFNSRREAITADAVLASAAIPTIFRAVHLGGGTFWDGLFSQNPPVRELADTRPDEIWVVQINPRDRATEPMSVTEIADRRNELAGNLSLHQELHFIEKIDELLEEGVIAPGGRYKQIMVRIIELSRSRLSAWLGPASKLNRDPAFIDELIAHGELRADEFLAALSFERAWRAGDADAVLAHFAEDAALAAPGADGELEAFVRGRLAANVAVDVTRKQVARDGVTWTVRIDGRPARAHAELRDGRITRFTID